MISDTSLNQTPIKVIFCGSFLEYSALVLAGLLNNPLITVLAVVTTPPALNTKTKQLQPNPVHELASTHHLPVFTPDHLDSASLAELGSVGPADILLTAGYGKLLPASWLEYPTLAALNLHFSLLPAYRGANPAEWALLRGETQTGVTLIEMSPQFDTGMMVAQSSSAITPTDTREDIYQKLYSLGAEIMAPALIAYVAYKKGASADASTPNHSGSELTLLLPPQDQGSSPTPYAKRLGRADGFVSWDAVQAAQKGQTYPDGSLSPILEGIFRSTHSNNSTTWPHFLERATRALSGFPGLWTEVPTAKGPKRLKILQTHVENNTLRLDEVQLEGLKPTPWNQIKNNIQEK